MKALITAGGYATRLFPATKAVPKAMLPLGSKPLIQRVVEELHSVGVDWIAVLCRGEQATIESHFRTRAQLLSTLCKDGNAHMTEVVTRIDALADFTFLPFEDTRSFSDAVLRARSLVEGEPFVLALSDEIDRPCATTTVSARLIETFSRQNCTLVAYDRTLVPEDIAAIREPYRLRRIADLERRPEDLFIVGRFLFAEDFMDSLARSVQADGRADYLAALNELGARGRLVAMPFDGNWWHCGDHVGYQKAFIDFALADVELGPEVRAYLLDRLAVPDGAQSEFRSLDASRRVVSE